LWTGDLPIGGEKNIGRGRLLGIEATIQYSYGDKESEVKIIREHDGLMIHDPNQFFNTFNQWRDVG